MKHLFGIFAILLCLSSLNGLAIEKKIPSKPNDSLTKANAAIDTVEVYDPQSNKKVRVYSEDTLVFDDLEAPKTKDGDGEYFINSKETKATIAFFMPNPEKNQSEKMDETTIPFAEDFGNIFPNPARANAAVTIQLNATGSKSILLRSANGETNKLITTSDTEINLFDLSPGIYFLQINYQDKIKTQRLYVQ